MATGLPLVPTTVRSTREAATGQVELTLEATPDLIAAHTIVGQYCAVRAPGSEQAHLALWSTPAERELRFLVRAEGLGQSLASLGVGDPVEVSAPTGPGFALDGLRGLDVVFVATGTGIAPIRAALTSVLSESASWGTLALYYGVRGADHVAVGDELAAWNAAGVHIRTCFSRDDAGGRGEYVQDVLFGDAPDLARCAFVVAGQQDVVTAIRTWTRERGGPEGRVLLNL